MRAKGLPASVVEPLGELRTTRRCCVDHRRGLLCDSGPDLRMIKLRRGATGGRRSSVENIDALN